MEVVDGPHDAPISKKGQVTLPEPIRARLQVTGGDRVHFLTVDVLPGVAVVVPQRILIGWLSTGIEVELAARELERGTSLDILLGAVLHPDSASASSPDASADRDEG